MSLVPPSNSGNASRAPGEPAWEIAHLFPLQGSWDEDEYLALDDAGRLVELSDGCIEVLPMTTKPHQRIAQFFFQVLSRFVSDRASGEVFIAPLPVRLWPGKWREPDVIFLEDNRDEFRGRPEGADLVVEVVSDDDEDRRRDLVHKPRDYARAGIPEYWIVAPKLEQITVLTLDAESYREHGVHKIGDTARSVLLDGFELSVAEVFAAARGPVR
jgi:Uma2 family endonuclease